jgi:hypothetical protein
VAVAVAALVAAAALAGCGGDRAPRTVELAPYEPGGALGTATLREQDGRVRGSVVVWGLAPGSRHLVHLAPGGCAWRPAPRVRLPVLVAGANGVAYARVDAPAPDGAAGWALTVHTGASARTARTACGPSRTLTAADLRDAGPGPAAGADASALVQLPAAGVQRLRVRRGGRLAVAVRTQRPAAVVVGTERLRLAARSIARRSVVVDRRVEVRADGRLVLVAEPR